jgi:hypothetical protein
MEGAVVGLIALFVSVVLWWFERRDRRRERREDQERANAQGREISELREKTDARLDRIGTAIEALGGPPDENAMLSCAFGSSGKRNNDRLIVTNLGPGSAQFRAFEIVSEGNIQLRTELQNGPIDLVGGESHAMVYAVPMGVERPVRVVMTWLDKTGERQREQAVNLR